MWSFACSLRHVVELLANKKVYRLLYNSRLLHAESILSWFRKQDIDNSITWRAFKEYRFFLIIFCLLNQKAPNIITISSNPWRCSGFTSRKKDNTESKHLRSSHFVVAQRDIESPKLESNDLKLNTPYQWNTSPSSLLLLTLMLMLVFGASTY